MSGYAAGETTVHDSVESIARVTRALRATGRPVVLVPTMGALHEGHLELVRAARTLPRAVVVASIFVNPLQFGEGEDFSAYPRDLEADIAKLRAEGVELVFTPDAEMMYPHGFRTTVSAGPLAGELEGAARPGHFDGALTVVSKLFQITHCTDAIFGEKDYQQLVLMQQMVTDLDLEVRLHAVPVIREADGLAMSSRNRYLGAADREAAVTLSAALTAGAHAGDRGPAAVLAAARAVLESRPEVAVDYLELRDPQLGELAEDATEARLLVAARVGGTRLLDNVGVLLGDESERREREIAQAALTAAGVDDAPLSAAELAELRRLRAEVRRVREERLAAEDRLAGAGFAGAAAAGPGDGDDDGTGAAGAGEDDEGGRS